MHKRTALKEISKFTLKQLLHVSLQLPPSGSVLFELAKVIVQLQLSSSSYSTTALSDWPWLPLSLMPIPLYPKLSFSIVSHQASLNRPPHHLSTSVLVVEHSRWLTSYPYPYFVCVVGFLNPSGILYMVSGQLNFLCFGFRAS